MFQDNCFQMDRHKIIPHQTNCVWQACHQVWSKRGRYGGSGEREDKSFGQNSPPIPPVPSSEQWGLLTPTPLHSVLFDQDFLQAAFLEGQHWQKHPGVKPFPKTPVEQTGFPARSEAGLGREMLHVGPAVLRVRPELGICVAQGIKLHSNDTSRD